MPLDCEGPPCRKTAPSRTRTPPTPATERRTRPPDGTASSSLGAAALVALGLGGVVVATTGDDRPAPAAVSLDAQSRAEAASRADRSDPRADSAGSPSATPSAEPDRRARRPAPARRRRRRPPPSRRQAEEGCDEDHEAHGRLGRTRCRAPRITSCYGQRWGTLHAGIDLALPSGTPDPRRGRRHRHQGRRRLRRVRQLRLHRPRQRLPDPLRPPEPARGHRRPEGQGRPGHRLRGRHRRLHRPAPALRGAPGHVEPDRPGAVHAARGVDLGC